MRLRGCGIRLSMRKRGMRKLIKESGRRSIEFLGDGRGVESGVRVGWGAAKKVRHCFALFGILLFCGTLVNA